MHIGELSSRDGVLEEHSEESTQCSCLEQIEASLGAEASEVGDHGVHIRREFKVL